MNETIRSWSATVLADRYELGHLLGSGGTSRVHRAHDRLLDRTVAVKVLRPGAITAHASQMFSEALMASRIDDPHVVKIFDVGIVDGGPFLVMEALDGTTLADVLETGPLPNPRWWRLSLDVLHGLAAAHRAGVVHRDVKPTNVLVAGDGFRISDFGASHRVDERAVPMGTPAYTAPECLAGQPSTPRSDVFSAALVLRDALLEPEERLARDAVAEVDLMRVATPEVAHALAVALSPNPADRPASAGDLLELLGARHRDTTVQIAPPAQEPTVLLDATRPLPFSATPDVTASSSPRPSRARAVGTVRVLAAIGMLLAFLVVTWRQGGDRVSDWTADRAELDWILDEIEELGP